jgi:CheY-like chemotaxis protein
MPVTRKAPLLPSRILLVDDNHHGNAARKAVLQEQGFTVACALSGEEALEAYLCEPFDLVITDLKMKEMDGLQLIAKLRAGGHPARIILLSGFALCLGLTPEGTGADAVLCKSNKEQDQLVFTVRQLLSRGKRKPAASQQGASQQASKTSVARSG